MNDFSLADAHNILREYFAPWIQDMNIAIDSVGGGEAVLRLPASAHLNRIGGTVCGQAIMALADTAMVMAVTSATGTAGPVTTVNQSSAFLRPAADADLVAEARVIKPGRTLIYGEVSLHTGERNKPIAHVTSTLMVLGK